MPKSKLNPELSRILTRNKTPLQIRAKVAPGSNNDTTRVDESRREAYRKLLEEGKGTALIAQEMGVSKQTVQDWINHEYEKTKIANSNSAGIIREQARERLEQLIGKFMPLAMHEDLKVSGDKYGKNGELKHIEIEAWQSSLEAAKFVTDAITKLARIYGLEKIAIDLPKGTNVILPTQIFMVMRQMADKLKDNTIDAEIINETN